MDQHILEAAGIVLALAASKVWDHRKGSKRDTKSGVALSAGFEGLSHRIDTRARELEAAMDVRFLETNASVQRVEAFCIGPDGQNGFRRDIAEMKTDFCERLDEIKTNVDGLLTRERERLVEDRVHGRLGPLP